MIKVKNHTFTYQNGKGVFDLNFTVEEGEVMGYLGPNGAGKTTTIRGLLGFLPSKDGSCTINGLDCFSNGPKIQKILGYIPGESVFPEKMKADEFLSFMNEMRGTKDKTRQKQLMEMFEFEPKGYIKKFSKGMKQKLAIVAAFMHDPKVIILDEPTSGLDPLMQNRFIELVLEEKRKGKTILMSSHIFDEVERTCENVLIIKEGCIVASSDMVSLKNSQRNGFMLKVDNENEARTILNNAGFEIKKAINGSLEVYIKGDAVDQFIKTIAQIKVLSLDVKAQSLEDIFMHFYSGKGN